MSDFAKVDISETALHNFDPEVMDALLLDRTTGSNILWCTDAYAALGEGYAFSDEITVAKITGEHDSIIRPRALKTLEEQRMRTKGKGEVFTPAWVCNLQNNLIDNEWFGHEGVFNTPAPGNTWVTNTARVTFPKGKSWRDYVCDTRLEITCGEAPYLASRYDTTTGRLIPVADRIGLLDRKLRVIGENVDDHDEWLTAVEDAYKSVYGYEWQGDNLLLARESLLQTFFEYHAAKFGYEAAREVARPIAEIISWNIFQMDGLRGVIPGTCGEREESGVLFEAKKVPCKGCATRNIREHNGIYARVKDWGENGLERRFVDLINER